MQFDVDPLFGLKICLTIDRSLQLFLQSCQDAISFKNVIFEYLTYSLAQANIKHGRFNCTPHPLLLAFFQATIPQEESGGRKRRRNALSGINQDDETPTNTIIYNENKNPNWILPVNEDYSKVFPREIWKTNPPPSTNGQEKLCCPRLNGKGYCFPNCNRSHDKMNTATTKH